MTLLNREKLLNKEAAARLSPYLTKCADTKGVYIKINYVNADHVHVLVDLPTGLSIEELIKTRLARYVAGNAAPTKSAAKKTDRAEPAK